LSKYHPVAHFPIKTTPTKTRKKFIKNEKELEQERIKLRIKNIQERSNKNGKKGTRKKEKDTSRKIEKKGAGARRSIET